MKITTLASYRSARQMGNFNWGFVYVTTSFLILSELHMLCIQRAAMWPFYGCARRLLFVHKETPGTRLQIHGQTWFSCSLYSFHSEQAEQKSSALEHLCWRTPEYSVFRGGADRTVTWHVPKKMADHYLHARIYFVTLDLFRSTPSAQFYLFMRMFWRTPSTLKIAKSSPPHMFTGL